MILPSSNWNEVNAAEMPSEAMIVLMREYSDMGLTLYVGTDSMLNSSHCMFSCIIAVHSSELGIANYYFQKQKLYEEKYKQLENKILKEIEISIVTANYLKANIPDASIEVHIDIGDKERNATRCLVDSAKGWVTGVGYKVKIKPESWASSVADWHTK